MAERLVARVLDDNGEPGRILGSVTRAGDGKITRRGLVAADILAGIVDRWELSESEAFDRLVANGWCNSRITMELDE